MKMMPMQPKLLLQHYLFWLFITFSLKSLTQNHTFIYLFIYFFEILTIISMKLFTKALKFWFGGQ